MDNVAITVETPVDSREIKFEEIYTIAFPAVARFVRNLNGTVDDAKDIFQDAVIMFMERTESNEQEIEAPSRYIVGIAKHLWMRKHRQSKHLIKLDAYEAALLVPETFYPSILTSRLLNLLEVSGKKCLDLLRSFYYKRTHLKSIVRKYGFSSEHSATVQKYKCLEKMRETVRVKSLTYEDFFE